MNTLHKSLSLAILASLIGANAIAEEPSSEACAADLSPTGQTIFKAVAPSVEADTNLKKLMKKKVRPLVMKGKLKRKDAKANAPLAGKCLHLLKQEKSSQTE